MDTSDLIAIAGVAGAVLLGLFVFSKAKPTKIENRSDVKAAILRGDYLGAATAALRYGEEDAAIEFYLRAQLPDRAAALYVGRGEYQKAAEIFERIKNYEKAAVLFAKAGLKAKATEMNEKRAAQLPATQATPNRPRTAVGARGLEERFRELQANAHSTPAGLAEAQQAGRAAAEAYLAEGNLKNAAELYRDAGMIDEAVHLYVNVLGDPGEAAIILSRNGNHERAAELFELAGQLERAAATWVDVAVAATKPEAYLDRIERLSSVVANQFLARLTGTRILDAGSAHLFYRLAKNCATNGDREKALTVLQDIKQTIGDYEDVNELIATLLVKPATAVAASAPTEMASAATQTLPHAPSKPSISLVDLDQSQLRELARQVAQMAAQQLRRDERLRTEQEHPTGNGTRVLATRTLHVAKGLDDGKAKVDYLYDSAVAAARGGPSIETLTQFIGGRPCDLQNIEVYFRLGMALLARGEWVKALAAFDSVEDASPGYRDAWRRADEIRAWQALLGTKRTMMGGVGGGEGRYELRGELGRGGMAVVYRGYDRMLDREVALKFLAEQFSDNADMREMFQREAKAVAALNHPNVVTIHDVGLLEGRAFLCMEFVQGKSVETLQLEPPGLTVVESLQIMKQILSALNYAHSRKIIHRDIKPANIMRTHDGLSKLMDFGLAKSLEPGNRESMIAGTPNYMPPEQLRGAEADGRTDLFAIGVTMYEMLAGVLPFEGVDRSQPKHITEHVPALPLSLANAVMACIELEPSHRPPSAEYVLAPVEQVLQAFVAQA